MPELFHISKTHFRNMCLTLMLPKHSYIRCDDGHTMEQDMHYSNKQLTSLCYCQHISKSWTVFREQRFSDNRCD